MPGIELGIVTVWQITILLMQYFSQRTSKFVDIVKSNYSCCVLVPQTGEHRLFNGA